MPRSILAFLIATIGLTWLHCLPKQASASVPQITVKRFQFNGNTAFTNAELEAVIEPWRNQPIAFEELLKAHEAITEHYLKAGYLTSFALIPAQLNQQVNADAATITIQVVEGTIASVETIQPTPLAKTIAKRISKDQIFNQNRLLEQLQFLRLEPGVRDLQAELLPGDAPGLSRLQLNCYSTILITLMKLSKLAPNCKLLNLKTFLAVSSKIGHALSKSTNHPIPQWYLSFEGLIDIMLYCALKISQIIVTLFQ
jgi:hypothetical protein